MQEMEIFDAPEWFEALTLAERAALFPSGYDDPPVAERVERAARKVERWRREAGLIAEGLFTEYLAQHGLTPDRLLRILAEPAVGLRRRAGRCPTWLDQLARVFSHAPAPLPASVEGHGGLGILELLRPLIADAHDRVLAGLRQVDSGVSALLASEEVAGDLLAALVRRLLQAGERALVLELHACRLEGKLRGETPEERFGSFVALLREPATGLEILRRYPVLARDACLYADQWVEASLEMMVRLVADWGEIVRRLAGGEDPGPVTGVGAGLGDPHDGGRSVAVLTFASGLRAVYKPRSLAVDLCFQDLIGWLNSRGASPPLRTLAFLDCGPYGWMEHVDTSSCRTPDEVQRFHERQGAWVALFYALEATDFHWENLIAAGEHPVPIDLETLFQPIAVEPDADGAGWVPTDHTVLRGGLLPRRLWAEEGLDLSGMGAAAGQTVEVRRVIDEGTDRMRWAGRQEEIGDGPHLPTLDDRPVPLWEHGEAVLRGFRSTYRLLCRYMDELESALAPFADLPVRALLRPTSAYAHLLHAGHHPDYLQSALDRDRLYDRLWTTMAHHPRLRPALRLEREDLTAGDVPRFLALPWSTDLLHPGGERIGSFFARSGLELVRERLRGMGEGDLERQSWLTLAAVEATRPLEERRSWRREPLPEAGEFHSERFLAAARHLGDRLLQMAVERDGHVTWFHLEVGEDGWRLEPMPVGLYNGLSGVALFLAYLGHLTGGESHERLSRLALDTVRRRIESDARALRGPGAFSGWGGVLYTFTRLGLLWGESGLLDQAEILASRMATAIQEDETYDLIAGSAGGAAALLALHRHRPSPALLELAVRCGERLLAGAVRSERGLGWPAPGGVSRLPLTGFGHGTAGIAWALARLALVSGEERFRRAAREALRYERSWFSREHGNWPDLRESRETGGERVFFHAWCHGAPGIGLGRVGLLSCLDDPEMPAEIRTAVGSTLTEGFGFNHCLCHGDLGNLELVREAGAALEDEALTAEAGRLAARILTQIETTGPRCGASTKTEVPGLLTGLAGIGYGLLRAADPGHVPSVLLLKTGSLS
jgi:type 2 lantibiotic biosynthesis protein LanM